MQRKKDMVERVRGEIGKEAQLASARVVQAERNSIAAEVRTMRSKGGEIIKRERDAHKDGKRAARAAVGDSTTRAKNAQR